MVKNSMMPLPVHSEFSFFVKKTGGDICLPLYGEKELAKELRYIVIQNASSLRETVRFCAHLLKGIRKHLNVFYKGGVREKKSNARSAPKLF